MGKLDVEARLSLKDTQVQIRGAREELEKFDREAEKAFGRVSRGARSGGDGFGRMRRDAREAKEEVGSLGKMGDWLRDRFLAAGAAIAAAFGARKMYESTVGRDREEGRGAAGRITAELATRQRLLSLAGGDPDLGRTLLSGSRYVQRLTGMEANEANALVFNLQSMGMLDLAHPLAMYGVTGAPAVDFAAGLGSVASGFGVSGKGRFGLMEQIMLAARASSADPTRIAGEMGKVASIVAGTGASPTELAAIYGSVALKDVNIASTWIKGLATAATRQGATGGLMEFVSGKQGMSPQQLIEDLGSVEAFQGFKFIADKMDEISTRAATMPRQAPGMLQRTLDTWREVDPQGFSAYVAKREQRRADIAAEDAEFVGSRAEHRRQIRESLERQRIMLHGGYLSAYTEFFRSGDPDFMTDIGTDISDYLPGETIVTRPDYGRAMDERNLQVTPPAPAAPRQTVDPLSRKIERYLQQIAESNERQIDKGPLE